MDIHDKSSLIKFKTWPRAIPVTTAVLHHTVSGSLKGTEQYLSSIAYGYHYMIDKQGQISYYVNPKTHGCNHSGGHNSYTVGISYVCGGDFGPVSQDQIASSIFLLQHLKAFLPTLKYVVGHKDISPDRKIDPRFEGEPANGVNLKIHKEKMNFIAQQSGLKYNGN